MTRLEKSGCPITRIFQIWTKFLVTSCVESFTCNIFTMSLSGWPTIYHLPLGQLATCQVSLIRDKNINYILGKDFIAVKRSSYWAVLALLNRMIFPSSRVAYIVEAMRWIYSLRHRVLEESFWLILESSAYVASILISQVHDVRCMTSGARHKWWAIVVVITGSGARHECWTTSGAWEWCTRVVHYMSGEHHEWWSSWVVVIMKGSHHEWWSSWLVHDISSREGVGNQL